MQYLVQYVLPVLLLQRRELQVGEFNLAPGGVVAF